MPPTDLNVTNNHFAPGLDASVPILARIGSNGLVAPAFTSLHTSATIERPTKQPGRFLSTVHGPDGGTRAHDLCSVRGRRGQWSDGFRDPTREDARSGASYGTVPRPMVLRVQSACPQERLAQLGADTPPVTRSVSLAEGVPASPAYVCPASQGSRRPPGQRAG